MNVLNKFFGLGSSLIQEPSAAELIKIENGQLYLCRPEDLRCPRECIVNNACAAIRRAQQYNYQLVITRVFEDGEEDILDDTDAIDSDDKVFLIGDELEFRTGLSDGEHALIWRDIDGDREETFEFVATGTNKATIDMFANYMYKAMYERKYKRSSDSVSQTELEEFQWLAPPPVKATQKPFRPTSPNRVVSGASAATPKKTRATSPATPTKPTPVTPHASASPLTARPAKAYQLPDCETIVAVEAELYLYINDDGMFMKQADVMAMIVRPQPNSFQYWLSASTEDGQFLAHPVRSELNASWSKKLEAMTWNHLSDQGDMSSWCFKFQGAEDYQAFLDAYSQCIYEYLNEVSWAKAKADEQSYLKSSYDVDVNMRDVEDESDDEDEVEATIEHGEEEEEEEDESDKPGSQAPSDAEPNSQLTVGHTKDVTFVVRGKKIGVFRTNRDDNLEYAGTMGDLSYKGKKAFKPSNIMLHNQDSNMILMNPADPHSLFSMDVEYGKVVNEWKVHDDIPVNHIAPKNKFAQATAEQTLVGISGNALFRIDPRVSGNSMVENKQYTTKNKFSGVTTTGSGQLAVASEKGDIRLFDTVGKVAKTALPAMGDPIIGIDVTADGRWIIATCKPYLLLIDTLIGQGRYTGSLGFERSFPADAKPMPRRLQLRPEHAAYMGNEVSFTPARFNVSEKKGESTIVTSTGRYVVAWDFEKVKKGKLDSYIIKMYEADVVQDNFKFNDDKQIIVALTNNVHAVNKKSLKKLPRGSLNASQSIVKTL